MNLHIEFGQRVKQRIGARRMKQLRRLRARRLQVEHHLMRIGKSAQLVLVVRMEWIQIAQHQHIGGAGDRQLDLRHARVDAQAADQRAQRQQQRGDPLGQYLATPHVGNITAALFMETNQRPALLEYVSGSQARTMAITPGRAVDRRQDLLGRNLADMAQIVFEHALLGGNLGA